MNGMRQKSLTKAMFLHLHRWSIVYCHDLINSGNQKGIDPLYVLLIFLRIKFVELNQILIDQMQ